MFRNAFVYLFSSVVNRLTPFLLIPVLTRYLSPEEYAVVSIYQVAMTFGIAVFGCCLHMNIAKAWPEMDKNQFGQFSFSVFIVLTASCVLGLIVIGAACLHQKMWFSLPAKWWMSIPVLAYCSMLYLFNQTALRADNRPWTYAAFEVSSTTINLCVSLLLVVVFAWGGEGRIVGIFAASAVIGVVAYLYMRSRQWIIPTLRREQIWKVLVFSLPLLPHTFSSAVIGVSDRFFLESMTTKADLGLYSVGYSFGMVVMLVTDAFAKAWTPWFLRMINMPGYEPRKKIVIYTYGFLFCLIVGVPIYIFIANLVVPYVVGAEFLLATNYIALISISYGFFGMYQLFFPYFVANGSTRAIGGISSFTALINIVLNYVLISDYGATGAAWATLISYVILSVLVVYFATRQTLMPWMKSLRKAYE